LSVSSLPYWVVLAYLALHTVYVLTARFRPRPLTRILATNLWLAACFVVLMTLRDWPSAWRHQWFRITALWAPVVFFWWAYLWNRWTLHAYYPRDYSFDPPLIRLEQKLFGQPSLWLARKDQPWLADLLHLFYNTYYLYTFAVGAYLHSSGRIRDFLAMTLAVILGYALMYCFFPFMPVFGPRWGLVSAGLLPEDRQRLKGGWMTRATNWLMFDGLAHKACAMPSAHASTAVVFVVWTWRIGGVGPGLAALAVALGMALGAIYGRYHYLLDLIVGAAVGVGCVLAADALIG
jgi:membrane-associated phospholipid phosphatase